MEFSEVPRRNSVQPSCIVGIGASAGGLEALQQFLTFLPSNTGMAFVIIQHLAPDHKSLLTDILGKYTVMPVIEVTNGIRVERNHVYMIPPRYNIEIESDVLHLKEYDHARINHPIDVFFRSLAAAYENRAIAVILSGTGSDGTNGIRQIKEQNGLVIVQTPETAKFDGMPRNAIATGLVDLVQNPESIAREMAHIASSMVAASSRLQLSDSDLMSQVFSILKNVTNVNYAYYKQTTILRRIERRLVITHNRNLQEYITYLNNNPDEARLLAKEVLIGVTSFFRDAEYFDVLKETVIRKLVRTGNQSDQIRVWVAGCSTGEEAYSIAILFMEVMEELGIRRDVKIFATDLDADAISMAGRGVYGDNIIEDVSVNRLSRYFTRKGNKYVVRHDIRTMIIFAQHNVFQDPPFGKLDLVSCRNLLIYFQTILQRNLFAIFHMALNDKGYLFLGRSESVIDFDDIFRVLCANEKIFIHNESGKAPVHEKINYSMQTLDHRMEPVYAPDRISSQDIRDKDAEFETELFEELMPACAILNDKNEVWRTYGDIGRFLMVPVGTMTADVFTMIRTDLKIAVSTALREARKLRDKVTYSDVPVRIDEQPEYLTVVAKPLLDRQGALTDYTALAFIREKRRLEGDIRRYQIDTAASMQIQNLEKELKVARENLRQTVTELESVNAELQAANEELLTANEELQSSNEELQSVNEELYTVNSEYQSKVNELAGVNDDMANFLSTTLVGIIMVDQDLNIRKFTEYIADEFNVVDQDVGRSLRYLSFNFGTIDLIALCRKVLETMQPIEQHCAAVSGKTYMIRISPYHAQERPVQAANTESGKRKLQGLVLTFIDTTKQVDDQEQIEEMAKALREAVRTGREKDAFLSHMSHDMRTPMTAIEGLAELCLQKDLEPDLKDSLEKIRTSSRYLMSLIDEILETSRINAGKIVKVSTTTKEDTVLRDTADIISGRVREAGVSFEYRIYGCEDRYVLMDREHVQRILMNLLGNAVKYTPPGGKISLETYVTYSEDMAHHRYVITDTGRGISENMLSRVFLPFEQGTDDISMQEGAGLGLYICKNLVDLLGGRISVTSRVGEGSRFTVELSYRLATNEQIRLQNRSTRTFEDRILYGKNVMLVEDNRINAEVVIKMLSSKGVHTELTRDGQEALDTFRRQGPYHYQAILMDVMMPVKSGLQAAREIRQMGKEDSGIIPIIALTADVSEETQNRCFEAGMNAFLEKPVDSDMLFTTLAREFEREELDSAGRLQGMDDSGK